MNTITPEELKAILNKHAWWIQGLGDGERADLEDANLEDANLENANLWGANLEDANLRGADLRGADLRDANLRGADLRGADLRDANLWGANLGDANLRGANLWGANLGGANLRGANLRGANLGGANLRGANLRGANLQPIKIDYFDVLICAIPEIPNLRRAILRGRIDGSTYIGECACLAGTLEKTSNQQIKEAVYCRRDSSRPIERFFAAIKPGDTPENSQFSKLAVDWLDEFMGFIERK